MPRKCKCGGRYCHVGDTIDLRTRERWARFVCDRCGRKTQQKKRGLHVGRIVK